jgi:dephospho-CoA kinase
VFRLEAKMLAEFEQADPGGIAVIEAAILIETGRYKVFDRLILTACSEEIQIARGMHRDGLTREQVLARLSKQMPLAEKRRFADYVVDTGGPKTETIKQVSKIVAELKALQEK